MRREGITEERIVRSGDVMADAARVFGEEAEKRANELMTPVGLQAMAGGNKSFVFGDHSPCGKY